MSDDKVLSAVVAGIFSVIVAIITCVSVLVVNDKLPAIFSTPVPPTLTATSTQLVSCMIPSLVEKNQAEVEGLITSLGLAIIKTVQYNDFANGIVISQDPQAGTKLEPCQGNIIITVSLGSTPTPAPPTNTPIPTNPPPTATPINCPPSIVFCDDFSTNPNTNGLWTVIRAQGDGKNEASWDEGIRALFLTRAADGKAAAIFANYELTSKQWNAKFKFKVGGGNGADGFVFMFYKKKESFTNGNCGSLCFQTSDSSVPGYGVEFDNYYNDHLSDPSANHIAIIEGSVDNHLIYVDDSRMEDNIWHKAEVSFDNGRVTVFIDGSMVLDYRLENPNYAYTGIGFSAATGEDNNNHIVDDFLLDVTQP